MELLARQTALHIALRHLPKSLLYECYLRGMDLKLGITSSYSVDLNPLSGSGQDRFIEASPGFGILRHIMFSVQAETRARPVCLVTRRSVCMAGALDQAQVYHMHLCSGDRPPLGLAYRQRTPQKG